MYWLTAHLLCERCEMSSINKRFTSVVATFFKKVCHLVQQNSLSSRSYPIVCWVSKLKRKQEVKSSTAQMQGFQVPLVWPAPDGRWSRNVRPWSFQVQRFFFNLPLRPLSLLKTFIPIYSALMIVPWLELEQAVELRENTSVDAYPTNWRPGRMMGWEYRRKCRQALMERICNCRCKGTAMDVISIMFKLSSICPTEMESWTHSSEQQANHSFD